MRTHWLVIERLKVDDANAVAGFTYGAIPPTAFLGMTHAMSRRINEAGLGSLHGAALVCHDTQVHAYRDKPWADYRFAQKRHPLKKDGGMPTIVEQGRMRVEVSLVIEANLADDEGIGGALKDWVESNLGRLRLAGGIITGWQRTRVLDVPEEPQAQLRQQRRILRRLLPGYAMAERSDLLEAHRAQLAAEGAEASMIDAWVDFSELHAHPAEDLDKGEPVEWIHQRIESAQQGWMVPMMVGYRGLEPPADNIPGARDPDTPVTFCEPVHTIAQWVSPHRVERLDDVLWRYEHTPGWYLARNHRETTGRGPSTESVPTESAN